MSISRWLTKAAILGGMLWLLGWAGTLWLLSAPDRRVAYREVLEDALLGFRRRPVSVIERLLTAREGPLNGSGSMRPAFFELSADWPQDLAAMAPAKRQALLAERDGERRALLDWVQQGAPRTAYERDDYAVSPAAAIARISAQFLIDAPAPSEAAAVRRVRIASLLAARCVRCHEEDGEHEKARWFPLDSYERLQPYLTPPPAFKPGWAVVLWLGLLPVAVAAAVVHRSAFPTRPRRRLRSLPVLVHLAAVAAWWIAVPDAGWALWLYAAGWVVAAGAAWLLVEALRAEFRTPCAGPAEPARRCPG